MMSAQTGKRRRRQMANGLKHLAQIGRPKYPTGPGTADAAARREKRWRENRAKGLK